jgi:hypothetical protein
MTPGRRPVAAVSDRHGRLEAALPPLWQCAVATKRSHQKLTGGHDQWREIDFS